MLTFDSRYIGNELLKKVKETNHNMIAIMITGQLDLDFLVINKNLVELLKKA
jgi:hypothetical protein